MDETYIVLIIHACRIWTEPCRGTETFYFEQTIAEILSKVIPIDPQVNKVWCSSRPNLSLQQYHISKNWQLLTHRYFLLLGTKNVFCQRCLDLFLVEVCKFYQTSRFIKWPGYIIICKPETIVLKQRKSSIINQLLWNWYFFRFVKYSVIEDSVYLWYFKAFVPIESIGYP